MATIITDLGHTELAKKILSEDSIWVGIGRTTPWTDENNPPTPDTDADSVEEIQGYKKYSEKYLVIEDSAGSIDFGGTTYRALSESEYKTEKPNLVYLKFELVGSELPLVDYRQIGLFFELTPATGYESYSVLTPSQVDDTGYLLALDNREKITRYSDSKEVIEYLIRT